MINLTILEHGTYPSTSEPRHAYLIKEVWNDWFEYTTKFFLVVADAAGELVSVGTVKIGQRNLLPGDIPSINPPTRAPVLENIADKLGDEFFSIGQSENYYDIINTFDSTLKRDLLIALRDLAYNNKIYEEFKNERVMNRSLLREVPVANVTGRFHRLANGDADLTEFDFSFSLAPSDRAPRPPQLDFSVKPESLPPTNIHVLIGRNGVGKSHFLGEISRTLVALSLEDELASGIYLQRNNECEAWEFSRLVFVSFSAFDDYDRPIDGAVGYRGIRYSYVGLSGEFKQKDGEIVKYTKRPENLTIDFVNSARECRGRARADRWYKALETLESDPRFKESCVLDLITCNIEEFEQKAIHTYKLLSSGHKVVLLTISKLIELVDEKTLVFLDEPEAHLHPPLLSAFIRALSDLLEQRNGVAIIATHSPVVLQEAPRSCVWMLRRSGHAAKAERPSIETFGENVGILTKEVFGLEINKSGFHNMIQKLVDNGHGYTEIKKSFGGQLGSEAKMTAQGLASDNDLDDL